MAKSKKAKIEEKPVECFAEIHYILASTIMMPTEYTKFLCRNNGEWIVHTRHHKEFKQMFPNAKLQ